MVRIIGVNLPRNKHIKVALTMIYGIGCAMALKICYKCKIDPTEKIENLTKKQVEFMRLEISRLTVEGDLRRTISMNIKRLIDLNTYRGKRHRRHLPVRGQRTKTNAKTCKSLKIKRL